MGAAVSVFGGIFYCDFSTRLDTVCLLNHLARLSDAGLENRELFNLEIRKARPFY